MQDNKIQFWGIIDRCSALLEEIPPQLEQLYVDGACRLTPQEIERCENYLSRVEAAAAGTRAMLEPFKAIAIKAPAHTA